MTRPDGRRPWWDGRRIVLATALAGLLAVVAQQSAASALAGRGPDAALRIGGGGSAAQTAKALELIQADPSGPGRRRARMLAERAFARDPSSAGALTVLGMTADDAARARAIVSAAAKLSRRELLGQLWLIEDAVQRGDVQGALHHYDVAMRVSRRAPAILFPVLVDATEDPGLVPAIATTLARRPAWGLQYQQQLAQSGKALGNVAVLFDRLLRQGVDPGDQALKVLFQRLSDARRYDQAWRLYAVLRPGEPRQGVRNGGFAREPHNPVVFDWQLSENRTDLATAVDPAPGGARLTFSAGSGEGGAAARQLLLLGAGAHRLAATVFDTRSAGDQRPAFRLSCAATGTELARFPLPNAGGAGVRGSWSFTVPPGCAAQWLELVVPPAESFEPNTGAVSNVAVT